MEVTETSRAKIVELPHDSDAEQFVIGSLFKSVSAAGKVFDGLHAPETFYFQKNQLIYEAVQRTWTENNRIDMLVVAEKLQSMGALESIGGRKYIVSCLESVGSTSHVDSAIQTVKNKWILRNLVHISDETKANALSQKYNPEEVLMAHEKAIFKLAQSTVKNEPVKAGIIAQQIETDINYHQTHNKPRHGVTTGFYDLDGALGAMRPSDLVIIAGRPSMGKSAYMMSLVKNIAHGQGKGVGVFSLEMSKEQLVGRMISDVGNIPSDALNSYQLQDEQWRRFADAKAHIESLPIWIDDTSAISTMQLRAKVQRLQMQYGVEVFVIDYLQLMTTRKKTENRQQEISDISAQLKSLAKDTKTVIIACSQLSRLVESRGEKRPQLSDLRESGAIEQDADIVMMLYRPEYYLTEEQRLEPKNEKYKNLCEVIVTKNRQGPTGSAKLTFVKEHSRFCDRAWRPKDSQPQESSPHDGPF